LSDQPGTSKRRKEHRLAGAVEKFNRSKEQFDALRAEMDAFFNREPRPYDSHGEFDADAGEWIERFQIREPPPLRFGVILGDCVHNLRCCLDHTIWQATLLDGATPNTTTQFPIEARSEAHFEKTAARQIPGLSIKHRALVKQVQPYHRGAEAHSDPLAVLATLSNTDKHRIVNPTYSFIEHEASDFLDTLVGSYQGDGPSPVHSFWVVSRGSRLEHDAPWFRIRWQPGQPPPQNVALTGNLPLGIAFGEIGLDASDFSKIADAVLMIVRAFMADFPETEFVGDP
jgi:hypothetical protein